MDQGDHNPKPDPAAQAAIAKAKRLMAFTLAFTFIALAVVLTIIGYRVSSMGERPSLPAMREK